MDSTPTLNTDSINIIQWNAHSIKPKSRSFELLLQQDKIHMAFISETWLSEEIVWKISNYNIVRADRADSYGGVAAVLHKSVKFARKQHAIPNSQIEILVVELFNVTGLTNIVSIYCPPTISTNKQDWDYIFSLFHSKCLIIGDMNAHHSLWSYKDDRRGDLIYTAMFENNYICLNDGSSTRVRMANSYLQKSSPDISFATTDIADQFVWRTINETLGSDHLIIKISCGLARSGICKKRRNFKVVDWDEYGNLASKEFSKLKINSTNVQELYDTFLVAIQSVADLIIPWIKTSNDPSSKFRPKHYWNSDISKTVAQRRLALSRVRRNPTPDNMKLLKQQISQADDLIKKARSKAWAEFCSSVDHETSAPDLWRRMRWVKGRGASNAAVDPVNAKLLLYSLTPDNVNESDPPISNALPSMLEIPITMAELNNCIKRKDTSPGTDNISYSMIYHLPESGKNMLLEIYNLVLSTGIVPSQWREVQIVPILKPGRDPSLPSSLRPISLMVCPCKIFHLIITRRIEWFVESRGLLSHKSTGFRRSKSCLDNLTTLTSDIQISFSKKEQVVAYFMDIDSAYNNINVKSMINILLNLGIGRNICKYLWNFLSERHCNINLVDGTNMVRHTNRGLAQGDPLSPLLFNISTMDIPKNITNVNISQYADDFVLYKAIENDNVSQTLSSLELAVNSMINMLSTIGLYLSESKCCVCVFKRSRKNIVIDVKINGKIVKEVKKVKYLGIWLDSKLKWGAHINEICEKTYKQLNVLKVLAGSSWGVHPKHLRRLYISLIRSRIDYGSFLYGNSAKSNLRKIDILQNRAMRVCGGFIRSTPIYVMESELSIPPLYLRRYWLGCRYWTRASSLLDNFVLQKLQTLSTRRNYFSDTTLPFLVKIHSEWSSIDTHKSQMLELYTLNTWVSAVDVKSCIIDRVCDVNDPKRKIMVSEIKNCVLKMLSESYHDYYKLYTDGSKDHHGVGAAMYDPQCNRSFKWKLHSKVCIMRAELTAIKESLEYVSQLHQTSVVVLSDSKSALQHLARCVSGYRGMPIAYETLQLLHNIQRKNIRIQLQWIPSHVGVNGNEVVDGLAKKAVMDGSVLVSLPYSSEITSHIKKTYLEKWEYHFGENAEKGIGLWYRTIQCRPNLVPWFDCSNLCRSRLVQAFRLRSGHIPVNKFYFLMGKKSSPMCEQCGVEEDHIHFLLECALNNQLRRRMFRSNLHGGELNILLSNPLSTGAVAMYDFVRASFRLMKPWRGRASQ